MSRASVLVQLKQIEAAELGTTRHDINDVKYNTDYYGHRVHGDPQHPEAFAWCVVFQWWCFQKAGIPTSVFPKSNNVFAVRDWFKDRGRFYHSPMVGDLVIFARSHIGFVEKILANNRIQTIEGNASDAVRRRTYRADDPGIQGYCRPRYQDVPETPPPPSGGRTEELVRALPRLTRGATGADVRRLQALLRANGQALPGSQKQDGSFDGEFGDDTEKALKAITGSAVCDDAQWAKLLGV
jgi:hypothetical protein